MGTQSKTEWSRDEQCGGQLMSKK
ncbi:uncharacterized protein G2W53_005773 [Senna tora]|uniref:Uncharacterized protein n=1 Tax=Senna tora TaxID=362788 RepID=A0A834X2W1_9FABA|nr:uncharacterized protein G2W53_005773 [Senna tora]